MTITLPRPTDYTTKSYTTSFTTTLSQIRMKIGDTGGPAGTDEVFLTDERINQIYDERPSILGASVECVRQILGDIARKTDVNAGSLNTSRSQLTTHYRDLLRDLEAQMAMEAVPKLGGVSISRRDALLEDDDYEGPAFEIGMDENTRIL